MLINCDMGERGISHPVDLAIMDYIHMANIACGGHAGDRHSVSFFKQLAKDKQIQYSAHLSYPDKENFGRKVMSITQRELLHSLDEQLALMGTVQSVKFHGALYNQSVVDEELAGILSKWLSENGIDTILTMPDSELHKASLEHGLSVLKEAFAERTYSWNEEKNALVLTGRDKSFAHITSPDEAEQQYLKMRKYHLVSAYSLESQDQGNRSDYPIHVETICIHSDSPIALELARRLHAHELSL